CGFVWAGGVDQVDVAASGSVGGVGDRAPVGRPRQSSKADGTRRVACDPVVVPPVGVDHVDALAVFPAVEDLPAVRRPWEPVFVVGMAWDEVGPGAVRADDGDPVVASVAETERGRSLLRMGAGRTPAARLAARM